MARENEKNLSPINQETDKENNEKKCGCGDCPCHKLNMENGFKFGFGFVLANILGWAIVAVLVWLILAVSRLFGDIL